MENVNKVIRNKNVQYFVSFSAFLLAFGFSIIPLIDASPSPFSSQVETTVVANHQHEEETQNNEKLDKSLVAQVAAVETEASVKLYQEPNTQQFPIAEVKKGEYVLVLHKVNDEWLQVQFHQQVAWMPTKDVLLTHLMIGHSSGAVSMYKEANSSSQVVTTIPFGQPFYLLDDQQSNFAKVSYNGQEGYVDSNQLNYAVDHMNELYKLQAGLPQTLDAKKMVA